ncbi:hypothetical protein JYU34_017503 [Plutella xylostella]|uniref:Lipase domain-containing protein n=1 Tax=Plutella xylostella TaxID=51655 RepID=A0ABQ7Q253_PLUXY|nr:hypothetical protein JYU34_017503 [Plutella xylostella]
MARALAAAALLALWLPPAARAAPAATQPASSNAELSFAENVYVKLSGACRAIVDLRYSSQKDQGELVKSMKIVQLVGSELRTFPIDSAYRSLTSTLSFDISKQTKVIIHGFNDNAQSEVPLELARAYGEKNMFNVLLVDAEELLNKWYPLSVHNARAAARRLANLLANLEQHGAAAADLHLLGVSLGAHVAGWAGKYFRLYKGRKLGRITGLDPAGPCFTHAYSDQRLDRHDAEYVDVIHSNRLVQGVIEPLGHADYYLNGGGPHQPGCAAPSCSHLRAAQAYAESVRSPRAFVAVRCADWQHFLHNSCGTDYSVMGYGSSFTTRGQFYLRTNPDPPYGMGMNGTVYKDKVKSTTQKWMEQLNLIK